MVYHGIPTPLKNDGVISLDWIIIQLLGLKYMKISMVPVTTHQFFDHSIGPGRSQVTGMVYGPSTSTRANGSLASDPWHEISAELSDYTEQYRGKTQALNGQVMVGFYVWKLIPKIFICAISRVCAVLILQNNHRWLVNFPIKAPPSCVNMKSERKREVCRT